MKRRLMTVALLGMLGGASAFAALPASANSRSVESALTSYPDLSVFYAALLNTGVLSQLDPNVHYTIFAPTDEAFAEIQPDLYPCFYSVQCRPQVADVLRNHIVIGRKTLKELTNEAEVPTIGRYRVYAESPYVGDYSIARHRVLSGIEVNGNMIYRINGVIMTNPQLAQFLTVPPVASAVMREKTITTYHTRVNYPVPGGGYPPAGMTETVTETYVTPAGPVPSSAAVYPDGTRTTTARRTYIAPGDGGEITTMTRPAATEP